MSDQDILNVLEQLEPLLRAPLEHPNGDAIALWHAEFNRSVATAERGAHWPDVKLRAKVLGIMLSRRMAMIESSQKTLKQRLTKNANGCRALSAYKESPR
ncbi:MAG: hypothetical protein P4L36_08225 [Holophaga sp.]|nr:hypothetical protein [Holophaga sp.]